MSDRLSFMNLKSWRQLSADRAGNVTITFALALIPLMSLVGAAVDYSRANSIRTAMQSAADSTALAVARNAATLTADQIQSQATDLFNASFARSEVSNVNVAATYSSTGGSTLTVSVTAKMKTNFLGVMGISEMQLGTKSVSAWGNKRLRVALVLDTTGSMDYDGKMDALKSATKDLLDQLKSAATNNGDVYVSIIPFSKDMNIDSANYQANWIDWTDWEAEPLTLASSKPSSWEDVGPGDNCPFPKDGWGGGYSTYGFGCTSGPTSTTPASSGKVPSSGNICPSTDTGAKYARKNGISYNGCYNSVEKSPKVTTGWSASCDGYVNCTCTGSGSSKTCTQKQYNHTWIVNAHSTWNGCVSDRGSSSAPSSNYDRLITTPGSAAESKYPAEQYSNCSPKVMGLSYDWTTMKSVVNNLDPQGATNQPIGLVWGWQSLVGGGPLTSPAKVSGYSYQEAIVLLSDGLNTLDRWYGDGYNTSTSVDRRMYDSNNGGAGTCANVKAAGITIYTIHVNTSGDPTSTLLKNCASGNDKFWTVTSSSQLASVFSEIGTNLSQLRIAK